MSITHRSGEPSRVEERRGEKSPGDAGREDIKQTDEIREIAALIEKLTESRQAWKPKYWRYWQEAADELGLDKAMDLITNLHIRTGFKNCEYLLRGPEGGKRICFLEDQILQAREERYQEEKQVILDEAALTRGGIESAAWDPEAELQIIQEKTGLPRGPEAREFAAKWDLDIGRETLP